MAKQLTISIFITWQSLLEMDKTSILNQYRGICGDVLIELTKKLTKSFKSFLKEMLIRYVFSKNKQNYYFQSELFLMSFSHNH
jgi:hypothetical protein